MNLTPNRDIAFSKNHHHIARPLHERSLGKWIRTVSEHRDATVSPAGSAHISLHGRKQHEVGCYAGRPGIQGLISRDSIASFRAAWATSQDPVSKNPELGLSLSEREQHAQALGQNNISCL